VQRQGSIDTNESTRMLLTHVDHVFRYNDIKYDEILDAAFYRMPEHFYGTYVYVALVETQLLREAMRVGTRGARGQHTAAITRIPAKAVRTERCTRTS
jgi:hypothetical protein